jgi:hypothetical protein
MRKKSKVATCTCIARHNYVHVAFFIEVIKYIYILKIKNNELMNMVFVFVACCVVVHYVFVNAFFFFFLFSFFFHSSSNNVRVSTVSIVPRSAR